MQNGQSSVVIVGAARTPVGAFNGAFADVPANELGAVAIREALSIPSEPVVAGSIQVAGDGVATILLRDHQTTGGYPKIATLLAADLDRIVQLRPRARIAFKAVTPARAVEIARQAARARSMWLDRLARHP